MRFDRRQVFAGQETVAWIGALEGLPQSRFVLAICAASVAATFEPHDGVGMILNLMPGPGAHFVRGHRDDANRCGANSRGGTATAGVLLLGIQRDATPTPFGGSRLVDPLILESIGIARFQERLNFPSPAGPNLCGTTWHSQVVMLDPTASAGLSFTNGLTMNLGR